MNIVKYRISTIQRMKADAEWRKVKSNLKDYQYRHNITETTTTKKLREIEKG